MGLCSRTGLLALPAAQGIGRPRGAQALARALSLEAGAAPGAAEADGDRCADWGPRGVCPDRGHTAAEEETRDAQVKVGPRTGGRRSHAHSSKSLAAWPQSRDVGGSGRFHGRVSAFGTRPRLPPQSQCLETVSESDFFTFKEKTHGKDLCTFHPVKEPRFMSQNARQPHRRGTLKSGWGAHLYVEKPTTGSRVTRRVLSLGTKRKLNRTFTAPHLVVRVQ